MGYLRYTPEMSEFVRSKYHVYGPTRLTKLFNRRFHTNQSTKAIFEFAQSLGLSNPVLTDGYTVGELAEAAGCSTDLIRQRCRLGKLKNKIVSFGKKRLIDFDDGDRFIAEYHRYINADKLGLIEAQEAANMLGYGNRIRICELLRRGCVDGEILIGRTYVNRKQIEAGVKQLKETGNIRVNWRKIKCSV